MLPHKTIAIITTTKHHPELSENQDVRKSNNKGFKEATFIQMGRRVGDAETSGEVQNMDGLERHGHMEWEFPNPCIVDKNWEGYLRSEGSQHHTRPPSPGFQHQEDKSP